MADTDNTTACLNNLFQGIDTIIKARIENLDYDKTVKCTVVNNTNAANGEYVVDDGSTQFYAYSHESTFKINDNVYVLIPNSDYNNKKIITGKYVDSDKDTPITYDYPWDQFVDITDNILPDGTYKNMPPVGLVANGDIKELKIWTQNGLSLTGYNRLGLKASFKTFLENLKAETGNYGVRLEVFTKQTNSQTEDTLNIYEFYLDSDIMYGNVYDYEVYYAQEYVFDISSIQDLEITQISMFLYQDNNFQTNSGEDIPSTYVANGITYSLPENIFVDDLYLSFGYDLSDFNTDTVLLYTLDPSTYIASFVQSENHNRYIEYLNNFLSILNSGTDSQKQLALEVIFNTISLTELKTVYELEDIDLDNPDDFTIDKIAIGTNNYEKIIYYFTMAAYHAAEMQSVNSSYVSTDSTVQAVLINYFNLRKFYLRWIHQVDDSFIVYGAGKNLPESAKIHWYRYHLEQQDEYDELAGAFWFENTDLVNSFYWENFSPDLNEDYEYIKVIIENPSYDYQAKLRQADTTLEFLDAYNIEENQDTPENIVIDDTLVQKYKSIIEGMVEALFDEIKTNARNSEEYNAIAAYYYNTKPYDTDLVQLLEDYDYDASGAIQDASVDEWKDLNNYYQGSSQYYESDMLVLTNENPTNPQDSIDLISDLTIECDTIGYNGVYRIYNEDGSLVNSAEASKKRILTASYTTLVTGLQGLDTAEKITWYIPKNNTMIYPPTEGTEYSLYDEVKSVSKEQFDLLNCYYVRSGTKYVKADTWVENKTYYARNTVVFDSISDPDYYKISRYGVVVSDKAGEEEADSSEQYFRIKNYYNETAINNTVYCEIIKNNKTYPKASFTMSFGSSGTNGTDYTFVLEANNQVAALTLDTRESLYLTPKVYDYNNNDITSELNLKDLTYSWYSKGDIEDGKNQAILFTSDDTTRVCEIKVTSRYDGTADSYPPIEACQYYILKANWKNGASLVQNVVTTENSEEIKAEDIDGSVIDGTTIEDNSEDRNITLTAYFPIIVRASTDEVTADAVSKICYDSTGVNPTYYKGQHKLYYYDENEGITKEFEDIDWRMSFGSDTSYDEAGADAFYPQLDSKNVMTVPSLYIQDIGKKIAVNAYSDGELLWTEPIRIYQDSYSSSMLNSWNGSLTIDENNGTILSSMIGAGKKNEDNTFSGVLMGDVSYAEEDTDKNPSDIKEFYQGIGLYGYNSGIKSFGFNIEGKAFLGKAGHGQILFDGNSGIIQSANYLLDKYHPRGLQIDVDHGIIKAYSPLAYFEDSENPSQASVIIDPYTAVAENAITYDETKDAYIVNKIDHPYFEIKSCLGNTLFSAGTAKYYLKSDNYDEVGKGTYIDLRNGTYTVKNISQQEDTDGNPKTDEDGNILYQGGEVYINGSGNPFFRIHEASKDKDIIYIGTDSYYLQSKNFDQSITPPTGVKFDLSNGKLTAYGFTIKAYKAGDITRYIFIDSNASTYPLQIGDTDNNKTDFKVSWDGAVTANKLTAATSGQIGPFYFDSDKMYTLSASYGGSGIYMSSTDNKFSVGSGFRVINGTVYISGNLNIGGEITGNNWSVGGSSSSDGTATGYSSSSGGSGAAASFSNINATGGNIGDWKITNGYLASANSKVILNAQEDATASITINRLTLEGFDSSYSRLKATGMLSVSGSTYLALYAGASGDNISSEIMLGDNLTLRAGKIFLLGSPVYTGPTEAGEANYYSTLTGTAEFSDGSRMSFYNGMLVGIDIA